MTLADEDTNSILTDKANRAILSNEVMQLESDANLKIDVTARHKNHVWRYLGNEKERSADVKTTGFFGVCVCM